MGMTDEIKNITPVDGHVKMSERKCAVCGETFSPPTMDRFLCDRCLYEKTTGLSRAWWCASSVADHFAVA